MKYPRILHIPGSPGTQSDDRILTAQQWESWLARYPVVATEKMDGENTTMTRETIHARSEDSLDHPSRHYVKALHGAICHTIPLGWRLVGENLFAQHSVPYANLSDWFQVFAVFNERNELLPFHDVWWFAIERGLSHVRQLGEFSTGNAAVEALKDFDTTTQEGFVLRRPTVVLPHQHEMMVAKWVRKGHVQTDRHWMFQQLRPNGRTNLLK